MRWTRGSGDNVQDLRGSGGGRGVGMRMGIGGLLVLLDRIVADGGKPVAVRGYRRRPGRERRAGFVIA